VPSLNGSSIDCHIHVVGDLDQYAMAPHRSYTTPPARFEDYLATMSGTDVRRAVLVQPSCYGDDNSLLLESLDAYGNQVRGVAVVDPLTVTDRQLADLHARGVRGVRINLQSVRDRVGPIKDLLPAMDDVITGNGWHIQVFCAADTLAQLAELQQRIQSPLVVDHFGFVRPENRERHLPDLLRLLKDGAWVKLSGTDRIAGGPDRPGVKDLARQIFDAAPEHVLWGSDWPHTPMHSGTSETLHELRPYRDLKTAGFYTGAAAWFADASDRHKLFVRNPKVLYNFIDE